MKYIFLLLCSFFFFGCNQTDRRANNCIWTCGSRVSALDLRDCENMQQFYKICVDACVVVYKEKTKENSE